MFSRSSPTPSLIPPSLLPLINGHTRSKSLKRVRTIITRFLVTLGLLCLLGYWLGPRAIARWGLTESLLNHKSNFRLISASDKEAITVDHESESESSEFEVDNFEAKEAYVTFLSSIDDSWYLLSTKLLIYQLLHDPLTRDSKARDVVVMVTPNISDDIANDLESEGAVIQRVELIEDMPLPEHIKNEDGKGHQWKDQYTKLSIFNMTKYNRILYLDNDVFLLDTLQEIWNDPGALDADPSWGGAGIAAVGETRSIDLVEQVQRVKPDIEVKDDEKDYFNAGFMMVYPDHARYLELLQVTEYNPFFMEQALLNDFYNQTGDHPWVPLSSQWVSHFPSNHDLKAKYHALHGKMWKDHFDPEVVSEWQQALGRMGAYHFHVQQTRTHLRDSNE